MIRPGEAVTVDRLAVESRLPVAQVLEALLRSSSPVGSAGEADGSVLSARTSPRS